MRDKELRELAVQLRDAIACHDLAEVARLLELLDCKPDNRAEQQDDKPKQRPKA
jgi:hypothetical protein